MPPDPRLAAALADRYRIERELGQGGMATVWLAHDLRHDRQVAIKVLRPELAAVIGADRFLSEIRTTANLQHPHILPLFDSGQADTFLYYVMPYVEGESLRDRLKREGQLSVEDATSILREVLDALEHAHRKGIIHRDIKPDNVLLSGRHALVADFGVAKAVSAAGGTQLTTAGMAVGTPQYMAPEQAMADPQLDHRADLYSVAAFGYEMLTGRALFPDRSPQQAVAAHLTEAPTPVTTLRPEVPAAMAEAIMRGLAKDPGERWQTADEFATRLAGSRQAPAPTPTRSRIPLLVGAAAVLVAAAWGAVRFLGGGGRPKATPVSVVAVMPFAVTGSDRFAYLQEGMVNLLATSLDGVAGLRSVNAHALLASAGGSVPDLGRAQELARRFGAGRFVTGDLIEVNGTVRISASLFVGDDDQPVAIVKDEGPDSTLFQLVDRVGARLVTDAALGGDPRARLAAVTTASLPALRSYLDGERAYRAGQYAGAASAFQDAIAADSMFALAWYRLSMAQERLAWADASQISADQALRFADRLTAHQRTFLEAVVALRHGETWKSEQMFRELVATHPDDAEAWYQLGEIEFHGNPLRGRSMIEAREALSRALFYDPADLGAMYHLLRVLARKQDPAELDSLATVFFALTPSGDRTLELRALQAFTTSDLEAKNAILAEVERAPDNSLPLIVWSVGVFAQDIPSALRVTAMMQRPERPRDVQALGWLEGAHLELAMGRLAAARTALARAAVLGSADAASAAAWIAALPFVPPGEATPVATTTTRQASRPSVFFSVHDSVHDAVNAYVRGLGAVRQRDAAGIAAAIGALEGMAGHPSTGALAAELARGLEGQDDALAGRAAQGLQRFASADPAGWYERTFVSPFFAGATERFVRAGFLQQAGRLDEALAWYNGLTENSTRELVFMGPSLLRRSEILEQLGRGKEAVPVLERFLHLWSDADPEFARLVTEARERLARVRGGAS